MAEFKLDFKPKQKDNVSDLIAQLIGLPNTQSNEVPSYQPGPTKLASGLENKTYLEAPAQMPKVNLQNAIQNLVKIPHDKGPTINKSIDEATINNIPKSNLLDMKNVIQNLVKIQPPQAPAIPAPPQQGPTIANAKNFIPKEDTFLDQVKDPYSSINQLYPNPSAPQDPGKGIDEALKKGDWGAVLGNTLKYLSSAQGTPILGAFTDNPYQKGAYSDIAKEKLQNENLNKEQLNKQISDRAKALLDLSQQYATRDFDRKKQKTDQDFKDKELTQRLNESKLKYMGDQDIRRESIAARTQEAKQRAEDKKQSEQDKNKEKKDTEKLAALEPFDKLTNMLDAIDQNIGAGIPVDEKGNPKELSGPEYFTTLLKLKAQAKNPTLQSPEQRQLSTDLPLIADVVNKSFGGARAMSGIKNALKALSDPTEPSIKNRKAQLNEVRSLLNGERQATEKRFAGGSHEKIIKLDANGKIIR